MAFTCRDFGAQVSIVPAGTEIRKGNRVIRIRKDQWVYAEPLAKDFETYFNCVVPTQVGEDLVVDYSQSAVYTFRVSGLEFEMASFPEEEETVLDYFKWHTPTAGETVFDIGANCGLSSYYLSKAVGDTGKVIAFEPDPTSYAVLLRNIARHGLANVTPVNAAIFDVSGKMSFNCEGTIGSTLVSVSSRPTVGSVVSVDALSLEDACSRYGTPKFIKMDIEGAEIEVLDSAREFLNEQCIQLAIDTHHFRDGQLTTTSVENILKACGYEVFSSMENVFMTTWARKPALA